MVDGRDGHRTDGQDGRTAVFAHKTDGTDGQDGWTAVFSHQTDGTDGQLCLFT